MKWDNYKVTAVVFVIFLIIDVFFLATKSVIPYFILIFELVVLILISVFTIKTVIINPNSITIRYVLQFRQVKYEKSDIDFLQFNYTQGSKTQEIRLRLHLKKERYFSRITLKDFICRNEIEKLRHFFKENGYIVKFKGDFYWLKR